MQKESTQRSSGYHTRSSSQSLLEDSPPPSTRANQFPADNTQISPPAKGQSNLCTSAEELIASTEEDEDHMRVQKTGPSYIAGRRRHAVPQIHKCVDINASVPPVEDAAVENGNQYASTKLKKVTHSNLLVAAAPSQQLPAMPFTTNMGPAGGNHNISVDVGEESEVEISALHAQHKRSAQRAIDIGKNMEATNAAQFIHLDGQKTVGSTDNATEMPHSPPCRYDKARGKKNKTTDDSDPMPFLQSDEWKNLTIAVMHTLQFITKPKPVLTTTDKMFAALQARLEGLHEPHTQCKIMNAMEQLVYDVDVAQAAPRIIELSSPENSHHSSELEIHGDDESRDKEHSTQLEPPALKVPKNTTNKASSTPDNPMPNCIQGKKLHAEHTKGKKPNPKK